VHGGVDVRVGPLGRVERVVEASGRVEHRAGCSVGIVDGELAALHAVRDDPRQLGARASTWAVITSRASPASWT
jgi:hypothetical protein